MKRKVITGFLIIINIYNNCLWKGMTNIKGMGKCMRACPCVLSKPNQKPLSLQLYSFPTRH